MTLTATRSSTQDSSTGTQVATAINEDSGGGALQASIPVGNKTTYSEGSRTGLTTADTSTTDLTTAGFAGSAGANLIDISNALSLVIRAQSNTASKILTGRVIFYDGSNNPIAFSESLSFTSDASLTIAGSGQKYPSQHQIIDAGASRKVRFYVDSISGGTWDICVRPV